MPYLISLLLIIILSLMVVRIATVALTLTGLSKESARFQARSAFTGTGFTTRESENVVNHPVRRRIIMGLMVIRSGGIVTAVASLLLSFLNIKGIEEGFLRLSILLGVIVVLWFISMSKWLDQKLSQIIEWMLNHWTTLSVRDYASLLHLAGPYSIIELHVREGDWLADKKLNQIKLKDEGILVLGIQRADGTYLGTPRGESLIHAGDTLIAYGRADFIRELDKRPNDVKGFLEHQQAIREQKDQLKI
ncbi:potassium transporter TrkA [bacterium]|nr:potassium transporter TrkA [bacterium]